MWKQLFLEGSDKALDLTVTHASLFEAKTIALIIIAKYFFFLLEISTPIIRFIPQSMINVASLQTLKIWTDNVSELLTKKPALIPNDTHTTTKLLIICDDL